MKRTEAEWAEWERARDQAAIDDMDAFAERLGIPSWSGHVASVHPMKRKVPVTPKVAKYEARWKAAGK